MTHSRSLKSFAVALTFLLASCAGGPDAQLEANKALILRLNDLQNDWDFDTMQTLMTPDLKRHCQATPEADVNSRDDYIELLKMWQGITPDANQTINQILAEGDRVAVHFTFSATQTGPMGPFPATGNRFSSDGLAIFRIEEGRVAELWVEWDNLAILNQLGLFPPAPPEKTS